ncbi:MAG TPA: hypothetical protein VFW48_03620 [Solirubrobacterales bacterium]|nr:hypothetical protein [Solirubrobacterales bacterium]
MKTTTLALLLVLVMPLPAGAAVRVVAPPGNSEADQYYQTLPGATGPRAPDSAKETRDAVRDGALSEATEGALRQRGPEGLAVATVVAKTAPAGVPGGAGDRDGSRAAASASAVRVLDDQGLGAFFPLLLALTAAGAVAFGVARWRGLVTR